MNTAGYNFVLINPVSITTTDNDGNVNDQIQAVRANTASPLLPTDSFPQSTWTRWTHNLYNDNNQFAAARVYFAIPASGEGGKGVNYNETLHSYDALGRSNRLVNGGGTITRTVLEPRGLPLSVWIGTNDTGATDTDPSGGAFLPLPPGEGRGEGASPAYYLPTYARAADISGTTIVEQTETLWDADSNAIQTTFRRRFHNATGLGPLTEPGGAQPQARVTYAAMYPDGIGRTQAVADYGTNGDVPLTRPDTIPQAPSPFTSLSRSTIIVANRISPSTRWARSIKRHLTTPAAACNSSAITDPASPAPAT